MIAGFHLVACSICSAQATSSAPSPQWIWAPGEATSGQVIFFRHEFPVAGAIKKATVAATCDNRMNVFVNGQSVMQSTEWQQPSYADVTKIVKTGENVIGVRAQNDDGIAAFVLSLVVELADGTKQHIVTSPAWKTSADQAANPRGRKPEDATWANAVAKGPLGMAPWGAVKLNPEDGPPKVVATTQGNIKAVDGFEVELLYSVPKESEGSWVSLTVDPKGRLIASDQYGKLYRITPPKFPSPGEEATEVEALDVNIGMAQGLLYAFDSLYVVVNGNAAQGSGLYRLRDTNGDDQFDEVKLLKRLNGGGEHGPHAVRLGPDGKSLYVIAGNHTAPPEGLAETSPNKNWDEDLLLKRNPDGNGHATGRMAPGGWIAKTDPNGETWSLISAGYRNPYDMDFNLDGELFTYDADMEWDTGAPWYRPTRVNHAVSGSEFGWRFGTGKWPDYYVDSVGAVVDIGLGSPTGVEFGTNAKFPEKYQRAFYILDWTYGKIYAVHMKPTGATYTGTFETFVEGKPLPVTDIVVNPKDGALYFTIGGRRTQSGLYRVTYTGKESTAPASPIQDPAAAEARKLRHELEAFHKPNAEGAVEFAWPHLNSVDPAIRYAARIAIEHQPIDSWIEKAKAETRRNALIEAMVAVTRSNEAKYQPLVLEKLGSLPFQRLSEDQVLDALRTYQLAFIRLGKDWKNDGTGAPAPSPEARQAVLKAIDSLYPAASGRVNHELTRLLVFLNAPNVAERAMALLRGASTQQDQLFYAFELRTLDEGWTPELRREFFSLLSLAEKKYRGGNSFKKFIDQIRNDAVATLSEDEKAQYAEVLAGNVTEEEVASLETTRQFVHNWQMSDLADQLGTVQSGRNFERGELAFKAAQCAKCHRFAGNGGDSGPDITGVGNRFDARYILESLIEPSKAVSDQYQSTIIETADGDLIVGRVIEDVDNVLKIQTNPFTMDLTTVAKDDIEVQEPNPQSQMPQGLLNVLSQEEILDLIAYLRSAGNPEDPAFRK